VPHFLDFGFAFEQEICLELGARLKAHRLSQKMRQQDLASRAGLSRATVNGLESRGNCTLLTFIQVVQVLGLESELQNLFKLSAPQSIADMEARAKPARKRAPAARRQKSKNIP
jgi:DNA-binding XRE family transcriptional regulator